MRPYYFLGGNRALTQLSTGQPFFVNTDDRGISTWIILGGVWETFVDDVLWDLAQPGAHFLDVGAHMGYYTIKIGGRVGPGGKVFSFEPNPVLNCFLEDNISINGFLPRIQMFKCAVADKPGEETLHFSASNMGGGTLAGPGASTTAVRVPVRTLDDCIPAGTRIDLVKIDAEGYEPKIIAGAKRLRQENPDMIVVLEVNLVIWRMFSDPYAVLREFVGDDREIFALHTDGGIVAYGDSDTFLQKVDDAFVAYCLVAPRSANMRSRLAARIR